jgi:hypothetical protein
VGCDTLASHMWDLASSIRGLFARQPRPLAAPVRLAKEFRLAGIVDIDTDQAG